MGFGHLWRSSLNKLVQKPIVSTGFASITNSGHSAGKMLVQVNFFTFKRVTDSESASKVTLGPCSGSWDSLPTNFDWEGETGPLEARIKNVGSSQFLHFGVSYRFGISVKSCAESMQSFLSQVVDQLWWSWAAKGLRGSCWHHQGIRAPRPKIYFLVLSRGFRTPADSE